MIKLLFTVAAVFFVSVAWAEISVVDSLQRTVSLPKPATRIVALAPHIVENAFSAGAGGKLIGVVSYSNFPEGASHIPVVGNHQSWSLEAIVALQPDLVLMWSSGSGLNALSSLKKLGVPVYVSEPRKLADIAVAIRDIGKLAGTQAISEPEAARVEQKLAQLQAQYSKRQPLSVFYQVWNEPLQTVNGKHLISDVMKLCGGYNIFADAFSLAPKINLESVLKRNPNAIVASGMGAEKPLWLDDWKRYSSLSAVRNNGLFFINPDHIQRPTARIFLGAATLCSQLDTLRG